MSDVRDLAKAWAVARRLSVSAVRDLAKAAGAERSLGPGRSFYRLVDL